MANEVEQMIKSDRAKKLIVGFREALRAVKTGEAAEIFVAKNCPDSLKRQAKEAADLAKINYAELPLNAEELSAQLKKPYNITVCAILAK